MPAKSREDLASANLLPPTGACIVVCPDASIREKLTPPGSVGFENYLSIPADQPEPFSITFDGKAMKDDEMAGFLRERQWGACYVLCLDRSSHWPSASLERYLGPPKRITWRLIPLAALLILLAAIVVLTRVYAAPGFVAGLLAGAFAVTIILPFAMIKVGNRELERRAAERAWRLGL